MDREIFNNVIVFRQDDNISRAARHYPNIFFSFPSYFLQCTCICNYIVASNFLLVSLLKKPSKKKETKENRQTMDFGVSAFSIDLAIEWIFVFLCEFSDGSVFTGAPLKVPKQTKHF